MSDLSLLDTGAEAPVADAPADTPVEQATDTSPKEEASSLLTADPAPAESDQGQADHEAEGEETTETPEGAPEAYADFTVPEGVQLHEPTLEKFKALAKEVNLPQGKAQQFVDAAVELQAAWLGEITAAQEAAVEAWKQELKTDPDIGGDKLAPSLAVAKKALDLVRDVPGLTELLNEGGLGNHPAVVKAFHKLGTLLSEDTFVNENTAGKAQPKSLADLLYTAPKKG